MRKAIDVGPQGFSAAALLPNFYFAAEKAARVAENGVKILRLLVGTTYYPTTRRAALGAPHAVHFTLRFSAEVFPLFATSSYWTC